MSADDLSVTIAARPDGGWSVYLEHSKIRSPFMLAQRYDVLNGGAISWFRFTRWGARRLAKRVLAKYRRIEERLSQPNEVIR